MTYHHNKPLKIYTLTAAIAGLILGVFSSGVFASWDDSEVFSNQTNLGTLDIHIASQTLTTPWLSVLPSSTTTLFIELQNYGNVAFAVGDPTISAAVTSSNGGSTASFANHTRLVVARCVGSYSALSTVCTGSWIEVPGLTTPAAASLASVASPLSLSDATPPAQATGYRLTLTALATLPQADVEAKIFNINWSFSATPRAASSLILGPSKVT